MSTDGGFVLYGHFASGNAYKVALMLTLCGASYDYRHVDLRKGESRQPAFRAVNRFGEVPVLVHGDVSLVQSNVILSYLADQLGRFGYENDAERWAIAEWLAWENHRMLGGPASLRVMKKFVQDCDPAVLALFDQRAVMALDILNHELSEREFLVGGRPTVADLACASYTWLIGDADLDAARWPAVQAWLKRLEGLSGWRSQADLLPKA